MLCAFKVISSYFTDSRTFVKYGGPTIFFYRREKFIFQFFIIFKENLISIQVHDYNVKSNTLVLNGINNHWHKTIHHPEWIVDIKEFGLPWTSDECALYVTSIRRA